MINTDKIEKAKLMIKESKERPLVLLAQDDNFNRKILEYGKFDVLLSIERGERKDSLRQVDSGFNHVLAVIAAKNKISFGIDLDEIKNLGKKEKSEMIKRIRQNIVLCRKKGVKLCVFGCSDRKDAFAFLISLGASSNQAKEAIYF